MAFNWVCPHCGMHQTLIDQKREFSARHIYISDLDIGSVSLVYDARGCSNSECKKLTVSAWVQGDLGSPSNFALKRDSFVTRARFLMPLTSSRQQPNYIPEPLREDYYEACLIKDDSPKAAATLVRRCLQGMIRDFAGISKARLIDEIKALREAVDAGNAPDGVTHDSVDAIDAVRGIGNIGAHMERDINIIVDVDQGEAQALIELVEMLFEEWYVARNTRQERLAKIKQLAATKRQEAQAARVERNALTPPVVPNDQGEN